ncbi:MAG: T9SS type A sorting domain-containing protein [Ignavibacteriales bacterium]|nr:T9SS type A sorting domain-containing protein [Ignavibacteriales bacterium]
MNKSVLFLLLLLCSTLALFAQIPNAGFESWTNSDPDGWYTTNTAPTSLPVTRVTTAHSGTYAARGEVVPLSGFPAFGVQPILMPGPKGKGFPFSQRAAAFNGWYQFVPASGSGDQLYLVATLSKAGQGVGAAAGIIPTATTSFKQFSLPILYPGGEIPDTCQLLIQITGAGGLAKVGSYFVIDDLSLGAVTAAEQSALPSGFTLSQNYPNPFNPATAISYQLPAVSVVNLRVFDMLGREVATLAEGRKEAGRYTMNWNASSLPSGMYLYQLTATSEKGEIYRDTKRAMLLK